MVRYIGKILNQAKRVTVKPPTKLIEIGTKIYEVGYHYKRYHGKKPRKQGVTWF